MNNIIKIHVFVVLMDTRTPPCYHLFRKEFPEMIQSRKKNPEKTQNKTKISYNYFMNKRKNLNLNWHQTCNYPASNRYIEYKFGNRNFHKIKNTRNNLNGAQAHKYRTERHIKADVAAIFVAFIACTQFCGGFRLILAWIGQL